MLTQNGRNAIAGMTASLTSGNPGRLPIKATNGSTFYFGNYSGSNRSWPFNQSHGFVTSSTAGFCVGSGNTQPTLSDYTLESIITSGLQGAATSTTGIDSNGNIYLNVDIVITNTSDQSITIREIGWIGVLQCAASVGGTSLSAKYALVDRTVLDNPVTIEAGEYETIRYRITPSW